MFIYWTDNYLATFLQQISQTDRHTSWKQQHDHFLFYISTSNLLNSKRTNVPWKGSISRGKAYLPVPSFLNGCLPLVTISQEHIDMQTLLLKKSQSLWLKHMICTNCTYIYIFIPFKIPDNCCQLTGFRASDAPWGCGCEGRYGDARASCCWGGRGAKALELLGFFGKNHRLPFRVVFGCFRK